MGFGINVATSHGNHVSGNFVTKNKASGIAVFLSNSNTLSTNVSVGNSTDGFHVNGSSLNLFAGNTADRNGGYGFQVFNSAPNPPAEDNIFSGNDACGNELADAFDWSAGAPNTWVSNLFCTSVGIPPQFP